MLRRFFAWQGNRDFLRELHFAVRVGFVGCLLLLTTGSIEMLDAGVILAECR